MREHMARLTAAADADVAALSPAEFDAALTSRLVGAERIQATGLGFSYASSSPSTSTRCSPSTSPTSVVTLPDSPHRRDRGAASPGWSTGAAPTYLGAPRDHSRSTCGGGGEGGRSVYGSR